MINLLKFKETLRGKCPNTGKYGPEKTPYVDTFHAVKLYFIIILKQTLVLSSLHF